MSQPSDPAPSSSQHSKQFGKVPPGFFSNILDKGTPLRALRTAAKIVIHTSGNDAVEICTTTIAAAVGVSVRTVQRDLREIANEDRIGTKKAALMAAESAIEEELSRRFADSPDPALVEQVRQDLVKCSQVAKLGEELASLKPSIQRMSTKQKGETREHWPQRYASPQVGAGLPGSFIWAELLNTQAWKNATGSQQGLIIFLSDHLRGLGKVVSASWLASKTGLSVGCIRNGIRYWRQEGLIDVQSQVDPSRGNTANFIRLRAPWDATPEGERPSAEVTRRNRLGGVTLGVGRVLVSFADENLWLEVENSIRGPVSEQEDIARKIVPALRAKQEAGLYRSSCKIRDIRAVFPYVLERRAALEDERLSQMAEAPVVASVDEPVSGDAWHGVCIPAQEVSAPTSEVVEEKIVESIDEKLGQPVGSFFSAYRAEELGCWVVMVRSPALMEWWRHRMDVLNAVLGKVGFRLVEDLEEEKRANSETRIRPLLDSRLVRLTADLEALESIVVAVPVTDDPPWKRPGFHRSILKDELIRDGAELNIQGAYVLSPDRDVLQTEDVAQRWFEATDAWFVRVASFKEDR